MGRDVPVIVRPALTAGNPKVAQFIDGVNSTSVNTWVTGAGALKEFADEDYTFVFPSMDGFTWSLDRDEQDEVTYETFMTSELPGLLVGVDRIAVFHVGENGIGERTAREHEPSQWPAAVLV